VRTVNMITSKGFGMSILQYGTMRLTSWGANLSVEQSEQILLACIDKGITTIDTADIYGNYNVEEHLGKIFTKNPSIRPRIQLVTKCGICMPCENRPYTVKMYDSTTNHILSSVEKSLKSMCTDFIDLLLIHRPDPLTHPKEIVEAFKQLKNSGKIKFFGVSNYTPSQFSALKSFLPAEIPLVTNQVQFSLLYTQPLFDGTFDSAIENQIVPQIWSPFGGGKLISGDCTDPTVLQIRELLRQLAQKYKTTMDTIALAWVLGIPARPAVIIGSTSKERVEDSVKALDITLTREEWFALLKAAVGHDVA